MVEIAHTRKILWEQVWLQGVAETRNTAGRNGCQTPRSIADAMDLFMRMSSSKGLGDGETRRPEEVHCICDDLGV